MDMVARLQEKDVAIRAHLDERSKIRSRIAFVVLNRNGDAIKAAKTTLANKTGAGVQWSKKEWTNILATWSPIQIAELLTHPSPEEEALADSHPFGNVLRFTDAS